MTLAEIVPLPIGGSRGKSKSKSKSRRSKVTEVDSRTSDSRGDHRFNGSVNGSVNGSGSRSVSGNSSRIAPTDPHEFPPPFDLISELSNNRDEYAGTEMFTLCFIPSYLRTCLDRVRARVIATTKPGLSITSAACIDYGISVIANNADVKRMLELKERLDMTENVRAEDLQEVIDWIRSFSISVPNSGGAAASKRMNIALSEHLRLRLFDLSGELGTSASSLATLAVMHAVADQPCVLPEHAAILHEGVDKFVQRVRLRARMAEVLIAEILGESPTGAGAGGGRLPS